MRHYKHVINKHLHQFSIKKLRVRAIHECVLYSDKYVIIKTTQHLEKKFDAVHDVF